MKKVVSLLAILLASITVIAGCDFSTLSEDVAFEDTDWVMESYGETGSMEAALPGVEITLYFDSTKGEFNGYTGINYYSGKYQLNGSKLILPEGVAYTQMKGKAEVQQQEEEYIGMLSAADSLEIVDGKLHLICDGEMIVYYKKWWI